MKVEFHLDKHQKPTSEKGIKVAYGTAKRGGYKARWYLILALIISPLLLLGYYFFRPYALTLAPAIITVEPIVITAPRSGIIQSIFTQEGDSVTRNQLLAVIEDPVLNKDIAFIKSELRSILTDQEKQSSHSFALYQTAIKQAEQNYDSVATIKQNYDKYLKQGDVSQVEYTAVLGAYHAAQNSLSASKINYQQAIIQEQQNRLAGNLAQVTRQLRQELATKEGLLQTLNVQPSLAGYIVEKSVVPGQSVKEGEPLYTIATEKTPIVIAYLNARHIDKVSLGREAKVLFPNGKKYAIKISKPTELASKLPPQLAKPFEGQKALLKVTFMFLEMPPSENWAEGMPAEVHF
jgi:multidrug resistance efflux pump